MNKKQIWKKCKKVITLIMLFSIIFVNNTFALVSPSNKKSSTEKVISTDGTEFNNDFDVLKEYQLLESNILKDRNVTTVQQYIDTYLVSLAGKGAEWYVILFYKMYGDGLNYEKYKNALDDYVLKNKNISKVTKQLIALTYLCIEPTNKMLDNVLDETIGEYGIMSYIFGLHLMNNGLKSSKWTSKQVVDNILSMYIENKGYSFMGNETDIDVTAMVIQALYPYYEDNNVKQVVDKCMQVISIKQDNDGMFYNAGLKTSESISQVILMASIYNVNIESDNRFIKNNKNLYGALCSFKTIDGLYGHLLDNESNTLATQQVCYSLGSMVLNKMGKGNLFKIN